MSDPTVVKTHFEDLQAEIEAGSRQVNIIAAEIRDALVVNQMEQMDLAGRLAARVHELQASIKQQRETLRELRRAIRETLNRNG